MSRKLIGIIILAFLLVSCTAASDATPDEEVNPTEVESVSPTESESNLNGSGEAEEQNNDENQAAQANSGTVYTIISGESTVTYMVDETFLDDNRLNTAIGETTEVNGELNLNQENPQLSSIGTITVDISQFESDSNRRDNALRDRFLESSQYPIVTFEPTSIDGLPATYTEGETLNLTVTGDTTIRETTMPMTVNFQVKLENGELTGIGETMFLMSDYGFGPISILGMLNTEDEVRIQIDFIARP